MVRVTAESTVLEIEKPKPSAHWQRNKKLLIDTLRESPFAIDRQISDLKYQIENNKNPQLLAPMKSDQGKVRSLKISAKKGASRSEATKAHVLNKIVREASGVHNYTLVPPPIQKSKTILKLDPDPETNPQMRPYAIEAKMKPALCSFGHRPSSASRTFHPATMKFKLKHGEIAKNEGSKTGFGLSAATLAKVLHAPKLNRLGEDIEKVESRVFSEDTESQNKEDNMDLFFTDEVQNRMFNHRNRKKPIDDDGSEVTWVSSLVSPKGQSKSMKMSKSTSQIEMGSKDRPVWDEAFSRGESSLTNIWKLKATAINAFEHKPLIERLKRFSNLGISDSPFCSEKQETDKLLRSGALATVKAPVPIKGQKLFYDPLDVPLRDIQQHHKRALKEKENKQYLMDYQRKLKAVPVVPYYPTTRLKEFIQYDNYELDSNSKLRGSEAMASGLDSDLVDNYTKKFFQGADLEDQLTNVYKAARKGDTDALFNYSMNVPGLFNRTAIQSSSHIFEDPSIQAMTSRPNTKQEKEFNLVCIR